MANIRVDVEYTIIDGSEVVFRSPVDCSAITGLKIYYPGSNGATTAKEFAFADAHGNNVGDIDHLFAEDVVVKVILDVTKGMAFVQNADTNAYLEAQLAKKMCFRRLLTSADDMDNIKEDGVYVYSTSSRPANAPFENAAVVFVFGGDNTTTQKIQLGFRYGTGGQGKFRPLYESKWNSWAEFAVATDGIVAVANGGTGASDKATARENLGAAPSGFGLGAAQGGLKFADLDSICAPGWYYINNSGTILNTTSNYWYLHVTAYGDGSSNCTQALYPVGARQIVLRRNKYSSNWRGWGYDVAPITVGVEYPLNAFYNGDRIYTKLVDFGKMPSGGGSATPHEIDVKQIVDCVGTNITLGAPLDCIVESYPDGPIARCSADKTKIWVEVYADCSAYNARVQLWYTKN